jgi:FAD/FMN-containing dehydrogenase
MSQQPNQYSAPSPEALEEFLRLATAIVGEANISRDPSSGAPEGLDGGCSYGDPFPLSQPHIPGPAIRPETVDHVRDIVRAANKLKVPLWTVSRGKNLG